MATSLTTKDELALFANARAHRLAFVFIFEGVGLAFTTSEDVAGISAAWQHSKWQPTELGEKDDPPTTAQWFQTAFIPGTFKQEIEFFDPKVPSDSISFRVADPDDSLAASVFASNRSTAKTFLTSDLAAGDGFSGLSVEDTTPFAGLGSEYFLYIGNETMRVLDTDRTPTGWSFVERALWGFHSTDIGNDFSSAHVLNRLNQSGPRVTNQPVSWYNRGCRIFLHHWEEGNGWSTFEQALLVWQGLLRNIVDGGDQTITFNALCVTELLKTNLFEQQFTGKVAQGMFFTSEALAFGAHEDIKINSPSIPAASLVDFPGTLLGGVAGFYTADDVLASLNTQLLLATSGLKFNWSLSRGDDGRILFDVASQQGQIGVSLNRMLLGLDARVWTLLGFDAGIGFSQTFFTSTGQAVRLTAIEGFYAGVFGSGSPVSHYQCLAGSTPVIADLSQTNPDRNFSHQLKLTDVKGTWQPQAFLSTGEGVPDGTEGYLQFGDLGILGGTYDDVNQIFTVTSRPGDKFANLGFHGTGTLAGDPTAGFVHESDAGASVAVTQIWYERAPIKDVILRLLLSTGTINNNSQVWDKNPAGMGCGVPWSLVDVPSFLTLGKEFWTLLVTKPAQFTDLFTSVLACTNKYLVWRQGMLTLVEPRLDGPTIAVAYALTNDTKAGPDDRAKPQYSTDGVINRVELKYQRDFSGALKSTAIFEDVVSSSDFGPRRAISVEAWGIENDSDGIVAFGDRVAGKALAYFSRPLTQIEVSINKTMMQIVPGDTVLVFDPYPINPKTGKRGLASWPAFVKSAGFDFSKMSGAAIVAYNPEINVDKICNWAPTARVDHAATNGGYVVVDPSTRYLQLEPARYSAPGDGNDDILFAVGDKLIVRELSPVDLLAPQIIHVTVSIVDATNHRLFLTAVIAGWDPSKIYNVTPDTILTVQQAQLAASFIADDATDTTGRLPQDSYELGVPREVGTAVAPTVTQPFVRIPKDGSIDSQGKPLAVGDLVEAVLSANALLAYRTRHIGPKLVWPSSNLVQTVGTTRQLILGPIWVPLYARGTRDLLVRLFRKVSAAGTAQFFITSSRSLPQGNSGSLAVKFLDSSKHEVSDATTFTFFSWGSELVLPCRPELGGAPSGVWLSIEGFTGSSVFAVLGGISVVEAPGT